jgi:hypothetical protein
VGECLSLVKDYYGQKLNIIMPGAVKGYAWADGYFSDFPAPLGQHFVRQAYIPGKRYPAGTMVIYAATHHIALFLYDNGNGTHAVYEQNADPDGSPAHIASRKNGLVTGIIIEKGMANKVWVDDGAYESLQQQTRDMQAQIDTMRPDLVDSHNRIEGLTKELEAERLGYETRLAGLHAQLEGFKNVPVVPEPIVIKTNVEQPKKPSGFWITLAKILGVKPSEPQK